MRGRRLRPDNFTPQVRTPWGGKRLAETYKAGIAQPSQSIGESWEVSVEPSFPSVTEDGLLLSELIATDPAAWLGAGNRFGDQTPLLVKLLDAASNLSVQVHPEDGDPALAGDESGKPEAWYVLDADPGAGLYLGFREGTTRKRVVECLDDAGPLDELMNFVTVTPGDTFVIAAGTAHAIGAGLTLVEPQFVAPGRRGITYRFWDWNRRYDERGQLDPVHGRPRALQVERSLAVTAWDGPLGDEFVASCRAQARVLSDAGLRRERLVDWPWFVVEHWCGSGALELEPCETMWAVVCVGGEATLADTTLTIGHSAVVPSAAGKLTVTGDRASLIATRTAMPQP